QPLRTVFAHRDAAHLVLSVDRARPAGNFATVANPGRRRIARQFGELQRCREALLHRLLPVGDDGLELRPLRRGVLCHLLPTVVLLDRTLLCHAWLLMVPRLRGWSASHCRNGKLNAVNSARASSSVRAVVHTVTSIPQVSPALSKSISGKMMCSLMPSE